MDYFADIFLGAGALAAAFYCLILSRKMSKLGGLDQDLGNAIAIMSKQVDEMTKALEDAKRTAGNSSDQLDQMTERAENVAERLELMLSALEDLPDLEDPSKRSATVDMSSVVQDPEVHPSETSTVFLRHATRAAGGRN